MRSFTSSRLEFLPLLLSIQLTWMVVTADSKINNGQLQSKIGNCQSNRRCPAIPVQPVCGSDRKTYTNICMLKIAMCTSSSDSKLKLAHVGKCKDCESSITQSLSKIVAYWKSNSQSTTSSSSIRCKSTGTFQYDSNCLNQRFDAADRNADGEVSSKEFMQALRPLRHMFNDRRCMRRLWNHCSKDGKVKVKADVWIKCFSYKGKTKCQQQKETALGEGRAKGHYLPRCDADGHFEAIQCHLSTGFCWCSTPDGKPIPGSSVRNKQPNCTIIASSKCFQLVQLMITKLHSHPDANSIPVPRCLETGDYAPLQCHRAIQECWCVTKDGIEVDKTRMSTSNGLPRCQGCVPSADEEFKVKFIKFVATSKDHMSTRRRTSSPFSSSRIINRLLRWKFTILDRNNDSSLSNFELNNTIQLWANMSRVCGKSTFTRCDSNSDRKFSLDEWRKCFSISAATHLTLQKEASAAASICTPMRICTLACPRGFKRDANGCLQCQCRQLVSIFKDPKKS